MSSPATLVPPGDPGSALNADRRRRDLQRLREQDVDVLVIGGGVTGAGAALDAASRGLTVALVEKHDLAFGTSRWSSKLVHGGLRYLAKGDVAVAWESATERAVVAGRIAPHLIHAMPQVVPQYADDRTPARLSLLGFMAGDAMRIAARTPRGLLPHARRIGAEEALRLAPGLKREGLMGASLGWDCQLIDDARLVVDIARTAAAYGARIITRVAVDRVDPVSAAADLTDTTTGESFTVHPRWIINATGVWAGELAPGIHLHPSLGSHAVIPSALLGDSTASLTVPVPGHIGRFVFTLPQPDGVTYVGLTDNPVHGGVADVPVAPHSDIEWILDILSRALATPIGPDQVLGSFAGVRPLAGAETGSSADISRRHLVQRDGRMITVTGGKLTTYRRMAADAVDLITAAPCRTKDIALVGAGKRTERRDVPQRLWRAYGAEAPLVWDLGVGDPHLREPVMAGEPLLGVEVAFARMYELAMTGEDVVDRRTRLGLLPGAAGLRDLVERDLTATSG